MDKRELRRSVRERLSVMPDDMKYAASQRIVQALRNHILVSGARVVALFSPLRDEPQIASLVKELSLTHLVALPRVEGDVMQFYCYSCDAMQSGAFGIEEPVGTSIVNPWEIDLMVVPGVAFTLDGKRMGRGKGYYDKYMANEGFRAYKVGVCYAAQIVDELPQEPHDIKMDCVVAL